MTKNRTPAVQASREAASKRLTTNEASAYLYERHGIRRAAGTLRKRRVLGGGPAYYRVTHNEVFYDPADIDRWVAGLLTKHNSTTSICTPATDLEAAA